MHQDLPNLDSHTSPAKNPLTADERSAIRQQMERILENQLFKQSKRYPGVLRFLVNRALDTPHLPLKERIIGIEVFGMSPDYDTNAHPTVRVVAGEIRKRLILYYQEPGHENELRIDLPQGSYTPEFLTRQPVEIRVKTSWRLGRRALLAAASLLCAGLFTLLWLHYMPSRTALDLFWEPVFHGSQPVQVCIGEQFKWGALPTLDERAAERSATSQGPGGNSISPDGMQHFLTGQSEIPERDVVALTRVIEFLQARNIKQSFHMARTTSLVDLRQGPAILIGSFSNYWSMRLSRDLRYQFKTSNDKNMSWIEDTKDPAWHNRILNFETPYTEITTDYALITRAVDPSTGHVVVSFGGLTGIGTIAASEFLVSPEAWENFAKTAPPDWWKKNFQIVIVFKVVNGAPGPPGVEATYFW